MEGQVSSIISGGSLLFALQVSFLGPGFGIDADADDGAEKGKDREE